MEDNLAMLFDYAQAEGIDIDWFPMKRAESLSLPYGDGLYGIAIDPKQIHSRSDLIHKLGHELGHCATGSFYNRYSSFDCRQRHENRAEKWAITKLVPADQLQIAVDHGYTEIWDLAELFDVPEEFMKKAVCYYTQSNIVPELCFGK